MLYGWDSRCIQNTHIIGNNHHPASYCNDHIIASSITNIEWNISIGKRETWLKAARERRPWIFKVETGFACCKHYKIILPYKCLVLFHPVIWGSLAGDSWLSPWEWVGFMTRQYCSDCARCSTLMNYLLHWIYQCKSEILSELSCNKHDVWSDILAIVEAARQA